MAQIDAKLSTGLEGLDQVLKGLIPGDNIVWQVDSIDDYIDLAGPYCRAAAERGRRLIYFRFAKHPPVVPSGCDAEVHELHPETGFEQFLTEVHRVIEQAGRGAFYVFDCLSELTVDWYSDQMLGNFFMLTCPYLFDMETIAYFALLRNYHSAHATGAISETAQVLVDVFRHKSRLYIQPLKVQQRHSPTMYMLHLRDGEDFVPVTDSATIAEILTTMPWRRLVSGEGVGVWERTFLAAEDVLKDVESGRRARMDEREHFRRLARMSLSREGRVAGLIERHMSLRDVLAVGRRMIGTGLIGGKAVGMLLARAILSNHDDRWAELLEPHDSFYIGSDVFYTFLVRNGVWWVRQQQRNERTFLQGAERARQGILRGGFPDDIERQFADMLDYFGQSPIIVRSSSLLEDNFGNAFAGKYESVFCANQGSRDRRLEDFKSAVRTIYASTMSDKALRYRAQRGLLEHDEQMALLVQRVSGSMHERLYYPQVAGVGLSFNPFRWSERIDPEAGMLRLVFGLGTRAVDRADDDYTRIVALNAPSHRPEGDSDEARGYTQRRVDVLDLEANQLVTRRFDELAGQNPDLPLDLFASEDAELRRRARQAGLAGQTARVLDFAKLLESTSFVEDMREMLSVLESAYEYPVDVEFTANFFDGERPSINLVQCRPLQVAGGGSSVPPPPDLSRQELILRAGGAVIGRSRAQRIDRLIYVVPEAYAALPVGRKHQVARLIGRLTHLDDSGEKTVMLLGPGRWGTTTPSLGVPASFADINTVSALCEIVTATGEVVPDVSLGTHYFNDLVESDILYMALFPEREGNVLNREFFEVGGNMLTELLSDAEEFADVVRVMDTTDPPVMLNADTLKQQAVCYRQG
ncbi:MAG: PEP/pyruvate-binding domain-containing protein [Phycisphaerae bacterium]